MSRRATTVTAPAHSGPVPRAPRGGVASRGWLHAAAAVAVGLALLSPTTSNGAKSAQPASTKETSQPAAAPSTKAAGYDWTAAFDRLAKGDWQGAADEAEVVLADPARSGDYAAAWGMLGDALIKGGMPYAGLVASIEGVRIAAGPNSPFYRDVLPTVDQLDEAAWAGGPLGADFGVPLDDTTRSHLAYIAARHHFAQGSWGAVLGLLPLITPDSPYALDGRLLQGVTLAQQERFEDALVPLLDVRERATGRDPHFQELVDLDLARTFYATGNFGRALEFYNRVSRADSAWPEALFERAWAHYRVDDMAGALGLLMTHTSPFFQDYYLPEAELLKAQSLYLMCKFPDTKETIGEFEKHYKPTLQQIRAGLGKLDAKGAWDDANNMLAGRATTLPTPLLRRFATDARFNGAVAAVAVADQDLVSLDRLKGHAFTARVKPLLATRRDARIAEQGGRVLEYARASEDDLNDMLTGIELTLIDLLSHEARLYEQAAVTNELPPSPKDLGKIRKDAKKKGKRIWPFEGEYWADELGWYRVESRPDCPTDMRRGE